MPGEHSRNSASGADCWSECLGALNLCEAHGLERSSSDYAKEGTILHGLCEDCLEWGFSPHHFVDLAYVSEGFTYVVTEEDARHMQEGLDRIGEFPGEMFLEVKADTTDWVGLDDGKRQFGTIDVLIIGQEELVVFDWKWGGGIAVYAENNKQLRIYALGAWSRLTKAQRARIKSIRIIIWQPRITGAGGEWVITVDELLEFGEWIKERAEGTRDPDAPRVADDKQCQWCPASKKSGFCAEHEAWRLEHIGWGFDDLDAHVESDSEPDLPESRTITKEQRSWFVKHAGAFKRWLSMLHDETIDEALNGLPVPMLKAIDGQLGNRVWIDEKAAEDFLKPRIKPEKLYTKKLISAPQAEKVLRTKDWNDLVAEKLFHQAPGKPILVSDTDPRPALVLDISDEFEDLSSEDDMFDELE